MFLMNKILSRSNSFNYYKTNYEKLNKENKKIKKENIHLKNRVNKLTPYYEGKIKKINNSHLEILNDKLDEISYLKNSNKKLNNDITALKKEIVDKNNKLKENLEEITSLYKFAPKEEGRKWIYKQRLNKELNLKTPQDFNEKINWLIVNKYGEDEGRLTDKNLVKHFVENKNIKDLNIAKTYKIYKSVDDININELPEKFVLKCNHYSGTVFICKDKNNFNLEIAKNELNNQLNKTYATKGLEYHYEFINPCIIAEEYLDDLQHEVPFDYKFYCFNGKVEVILFCTNRDIKAKYYYYDTNWNLIDCHKNYDNNINFEKPEILDKMINIAEELSKDLLFVRVDLYNINNLIYFGEYTFTPFNGMDTCAQETLNLMGEKLILRH